MFRKDYIIRLIEEFGALWEQLVVQIRDGDTALARLTLDRGYQRLLGCSPQQALAFSAGEIMARLHLGVSPEDGRSQCWIAASLFVAEAKMAVAAKEPARARVALQKARDLTLVLSRADEDPPAYATSIAELDAALNQLHVD